MKTKNKKVYKKIVVAISLFLIAVWVFLGAGTSLAWFTDETPEMNNIFHFADFELEVSHRLPDGTWEKVDSKTEIFDDEALYEPGYVQVVHLMVENKGTIPFNFYTAVNVNDCTVAVNSLGTQFLLQDYLKFGVTTADSEVEMDSNLPTREEAIRIADMPLHNYYESGVFELAPNTAKYVTIVVRMPKEVGNIANYRGSTEPKVGLGITVKADQIR